MDIYITREIIYLDYVINYIIIRSFDLGIMSIFFRIFFITFSMHIQDYSHNTLDWKLKL
jgi:hypothetical protein